MGFFQKVENEAAVLSCAGVYKQVDLYVRNGLLYAKYGAGYIKLYHDGSTVIPKVRLDTLSWDGDSLWRTPQGVLATGASPGWQLLNPPALAKLTGLPAPDA